MALDNTGSVQVQQGTLSLKGGGVEGGSYLVLAGATLTFGNDKVTTTSVALPVDFTTSPLNWGGTFTGSAGQQRQRTGLGRREPLRWPRLLRRHGLREPHGGLQLRRAVRQFVDLHDTHRQLHQ